MDPSEFPSNSEKSKRVVNEGKNIERVTKGDATRRKKSLRKQFSETFVAGDVKTAIRYSIFEIALPAARDMVLETFQQGLEKLILGDSRRRGSRAPQAGPTGYVSYNRVTNPQGSAPQRALSRSARARHNFDEIVLDQRSEAEEVIDRLFEVVNRYDSASVADLYELVGLVATHTDHKWGWTDLHGAGVSRIRGGYLLDLPEPEVLD
jgi:hypothetical protein